MAKAFKSVAKIKSEAPSEAVIANFINNASGDFERAESDNKQNLDKGEKRQRGRPKINDEERFRMTLYLTKSQEEKISSVANELGMSKNNYILYMLFKKEELFSNEDLNDLLVRAQAKGRSLKDYLKEVLQLSH